MLEPADGGSSDNEGNHPHLTPLEQNTSSCRADCADRSDVTWPRLLSLYSILERHATYRTEISAGLSSQTVGRCGEWPTAS